MAFGPENILFVADLGNGTIYAIGTGDEARGDRAAPLNIEGVNARIAEMIGATAKDVTIGDLKVNPGTGNVFLSVSRKGGNGLIVRIDRGGKVTELSLKDVPMAQITLDKTPSQSNARNPVVTAMAYQKGRLFVAGMSNEEFNSAFRSIEFPFKETDSITSVEIFHGSHGRWETKSPIRTFTTFEIDGKANLLAAYTCTPLVKVPVDSLKAGEKVKGVTVAELGNMNTPLDMVVYQKEGKTFILIANTARGVMKVSTDGLDKIEPITAQVRGTAGVKFETVKGLSNVVQLDRLSESQAILLAKNGDSFDLKSVDLP